MSEHDLSVIPGIILDGEEPVFSEPWEAQAFALAVRLNENGFFTWKEWAEILGGEIRADCGSTPYYQLWFQALEKIASQKLQITVEEMENRKSEWQAALLATPHGEPVELDRQSDFNK